MIHPGNQRWLERRATFRRPDEQIRASEYDVEVIDSDAAARAFVEAHHYSGTYPAARFRFGLRHRGERVGVAVFSHPCNDAVITNVFPSLQPTQGVELGRFVLLDSVPGNGETWFLARTLELLRGKVAGVVSFSDPFARETLAGDRVFPGHVGTIYQASNAMYLGRGTARTLSLLPDARVFSDRAVQKISAGEPGWRPQAEALIRLGADPLPDIVPDDVRRAWLATWLPRIVRNDHPRSLGGGGLRPDAHDDGGGVPRRLRVPGRVPDPQQAQGAGRSPAGQQRAAADGARRGGRGGRGAVDHG